MVQRVLVVAAFMALIGMAVRLRRDLLSAPPPLRWAPIELPNQELLAAPIQLPVGSYQAPVQVPTDFLSGSYPPTQITQDQLLSSSYQVGGATVLATEAVDGLFDVIPAPTEAKVAAKPSFIYKATAPKGLYGNAPIEILIVGSDHTAPYTEVMWLPGFMREFHKFLDQDKPLTCWVENKILEWASNAFSTADGLVKQAELIKSQEQSSDSDAAKVDWIKKYNQDCRMVGLPVTKDLTSANFPTLLETLNQEYHVFKAASTAVDVTLYNLFKRFSVASKGLLSVEFIEDISDVNEYLNKELGTMETSAMQKDVQWTRSSQLRPAYLKGSASTYFAVLPLVLAKMNRVRSIPERNHKWASTIHDSMKIGNGSQAVVVVGAEHFGRAEENIPESILDAFESLGYDIVSVEMSKVLGERKRKEREESSAAGPPSAPPRVMKARTGTLLHRDQWKALSKAEKAEYVATGQHAINEPMESALWDTFLGHLGQRPDFGTAQ